MCVCGVGDEKAQAKFADLCGIPGLKKQKAGHFGSLKKHPQKKFYSSEIRHIEFIRRWF